MEWIKASEQLPEMDKDVHIKISGINSVGRLSYSEDEERNVFYHYQTLKTSGGYMFNNNFCNIEWLDESPADASPLQEQDELWKEAFDIIDNSDKGYAPIKARKELKSKYSITRIK